MRKVPELRFDGFDREWEEKKLGSLSNVVRGASPRPISDPKWFDDNSDVGWLRISDVTAQNGRIHELEQKLSIDGQKKTRVYKTPHLILSIAASVGKPVINYMDTGVHDGFLIFEEPKFDLEYLFQWLDSIQLSWSKYGQPGSQVNLNSDIVKNRRINLPNLKEQEKIGELFRKIDGLIEIQEGKVSKMEDFKKSMLQKMFPKKGELVPELRFDGFDGEWEIKKISEIADIIGGGTPSTTKEEYWNGNINWFSPTEIGNETFYSESLQKITDLGLSKSSAKLLPKEKTILFTSRATIGNIGLITEDASTNQGFQNFVLKNNIDKYFVYSYLQLLNNIFIKFSTGSTFKEISKKSIETIEMKIPSNKEQAKIGQFFKNLDTQIENEEKLLDSYKMMKKSLLQKMFV